MTTAREIDTHHDLYLERTVLCPGEPLDVVRRLASSAAGEDHMVYENGREWSFATGVVAALWVDTDGVHLRTEGNDADVAWSSLPANDPLPVLRSLLDTLPFRDWRAYGWIAFELAGARAHGRPAGADRLVHLVVPHTEVRLCDGVARVRSADRAGLDSAAAALASRYRVPAQTHAVTVDSHGHGAAEHEARVARAVAAIRRGELDKVVMSRVVPVPEEIDLVETFVAGRRANAPARSFLFSLGGLDAAGYSPEVLVATDPAGRVVSQPLAGTRARTGDPDTDARLRDELRRDPKEVVEHAVSVRAVVEDLREVCEDVCVHDYMDVVERGSVQHLASQVGGRLSAGRDGWDALGAIFPTATASGVPKQAACDLIASDESEPRGLYAGAVLTADAGGALDAGLVLRTVQRRDGRTWLRAGGGIIEASRPERELEETREKLGSVAGFLVPAAPRP
ncbi:salicylate synthase [Pseudonocardia endophytica]|uniref:Salicylate synthetase n=1 Tax=Pseudonocardia endophytica TaxID=401976 RepID=A0A4R1HYK1_PSEEN|nr:salicylate synthase [Pseudonocardia endophytica]TCK25169.1 salicylate synthetase [Pseudonocardia endophytica]